MTKSRDLANLADDNLGNLTVDASGNLDVSGTVTADGLTMDGNIIQSGAGSKTISLERVGASKLDIGASTAGVGNFITTTTNDLFVKRTASSTKVLGVGNSTGDISFYDSTGVSQGFYWDADQQSLGLGTTTPSAKLSVTGLAMNSASSGVELEGSWPWLKFKDTEANQDSWLQYVDASNFFVKQIDYNDRNSAPSTVGTIRMAINSSGNVGIGTSSPDFKAEIVGGTNNGLHIKDAESATVFGGLFTQASNMALVARSNHALTFGTNDAERVRIDSSGNVGIGASSPLGKFMVTDGTSSPSALVVRQTSEAGAAALSLDSIFNNASNTDKEIASIKLGVVTNGSASPSADIRFEAISSGTLAERMRIGGNGNVLVGKTTTSTGPEGVVLGAAGALTSFNRAGNTVVRIRRETNAGDALEFFYGSTKSGSVSVSASGTTYNTTSDARLKTDIEPLEATDKLMAMNPVSYNWKADPDGPRSMGFIAQEIQEIVPEAVSGDADSDEIMSMDYGRITPVLVAALQDALTKIEQLEQRIVDMEDK